MRYHLMIILFLLVGLLFFIIQSLQSVTTIKYFPFDSSVTFTKAETALNFLTESNQHKYKIEWETKSVVDRPVYLRQDLSLLYVDGRLKGMQSKWQEETDTIDLKASINGEGSSHYQAITYHHAEVHYPEDIIKSVQKISSDELYVFDSAYRPLESFQTPEDHSQQEWKQALDHAATQQLSVHWNKLIDHFELKKEDYYYIPLTFIAQYETKPIPSLTAEDTKRVIAQLWEGLYTNYILPFDQADPIKDSFIPLVLFAKDGTHLKVLYQDQNGEKQQLIQYYDASNSSS
ncbi:hypothetical protein Pryu01_00530 [Paraliobacillus ryukyuensis]|uniref:Uncharacterized protein n=1 Tax=Paraliobacillus ryukyuensis TaxID=200904 RepID=A0A366EGE0_9BACI|nr:hypothetical protein [Paraliobacillus ryukyuensis]RBP01398.1 hypothetical protein DES48_101134 [Paraliobacillus ryukyuensis]